MSVVPQLIVVGAASRDVDEEDPRGWRLGGGVSYGALLAARMGARIGALIGVDELAATAWELDLLRGSGVTLEVVPLSRGPVFVNEQRPSGRFQICHSPSDPIGSVALPPAWRDAGAFLLAPVAHELDDSWSEVPGSGALVGLAWQGLLRQLHAGEPVRELPARTRPLFTRADLAGVSPEDLRAGGDRLDELLPRPGQELAITVGERGALHVVRRTTGLALRRLSAIPARRIRDLTGAGDAFLTTWLLGRLERGPFGDAPLERGRALHLAAVAASLTVESVGLEGLPGRATLAARISELRRPARL